MVTLPAGDALLLVGAALLLVGAAEEELEPPPDEPQPAARPTTATAATTEAFRPIRITGFPPLRSFVWCAPRRVRGESELSSPTSEGFRAGGENEHGTDCHLLK